MNLSFLPSRSSIHPASIQHPLAPASLHVPAKHPGVVQVSVSTSGAGERKRRQLRGSGGFIDLRLNQTADWSNHALHNRKTAGGGETINHRCCSQQSK